MIDFSTMPIDISSKYGGSDQKLGIFINGKRYMVKMSDRTPEGNLNGLNSSYANSAFSEHLSCNLIKTMGIPVQETILGEISRISSTTGELRKHPAVACENFLKPNEELLEFKVLENALLYNKPLRIPRIQDIYSILTTDHAYFSKEFGKVAMKRYWDTFIIDSILGNFDRHSNNWGYIINKDTKNIQLAPIYDCGSCLFPQLTDETMEFFLTKDPDQIQKRIDVFPNAALLLENGKKASYKQFISSLCNTDCNEALKRIVPLIDLDKFRDVIDHMENISDTRKAFYNIIIRERFEQIAEYSYDLLMHLEHPSIAINSQDINFDTEQKDISDDNTDGYDPADE